jgi:hypothetical protein
MILSNYQDINEEKEQGNMTAIEKAQAIANALEVWEDGDYQARLYGTRNPFAAGKNDAEQLAMFNAQLAHGQLIRLPDGNYAMRGQAEPQFIIYREMVDHGLSEEWTYWRVRQYEKDRDPYREELSEFHKTKTPRKKAKR